MKKLLLSMTALFLAGGCAFAGVNGFREGISAVSTVSEALKLNDNSYVTIRGTVVDRLSDDEYTFKDSTGTITVEIDNDKWFGHNYKVNEKLELTGEIEKDTDKTRLDVQKIKRIRN